MVEWAHAAFALVRAAIWVEAFSKSSIWLAAWLMLDHISHAGETGGALLLVYWALNLPVLGKKSYSLRACIPRTATSPSACWNRLAPSKMKARSPSRRGRPYLRMLFRVRCE